MSKYYMPELSDLSIGMNLYYADTDNYFELNNITMISLINDESVKWGGKYSTVNEIRIPLTKYRIKYLDKEDIESLGFICTGDTKYGEYEFQKYTSQDLILYEIDLYKYDNVNEVTISRWVNNSEFTLFYGIIKNKSELVKVLKQVGAL